jgi:murein DD-endopeptidase MepM/ murein hydrolase activator NlpD
MSPYMKRLGFETLESRQMLAADLELVSVQLSNANGVITGATPVVGEKIYASIHWRTTDLTPADLYEITWTMDGVTTKQPAFAPFVGAPGTNVNHFWFHGGFVITPGTHTLTVTVDSGNTVAEVNEANNSISLPITPIAPTSLPNKFITPLAGTQNVNWTLEGYVDVDARGFVDDDFFHYSDFQGNTTVTRDFHNGLDFRIATFAAQDAGVNVLAAAAGTVIAVNDGEFDRETGLQFANVGNYVFIDHGNGWVSQYYHLRRDSITVQVNDVVTAGQVLGLVGSSGNSGASHLHFEIQHNGSPVDPYAAPDDYFATPPLYISDSSLSKGLLDFGVTNDIYDGVHTLGSPPNWGGPTYEQILEHVSDVDFFPTTPQNIIAWAIFPAVEAGDTWRAQLYRPDGSLASDFGNATFTQATDFDKDGDTDGLDFLIWQRHAGGSGDNSQGDANFNGVIDTDDLMFWELQYSKTVISGWNWGWYVPGTTENIPGTWRVDFLYNDLKVGEKAFEVNATLRPEIRVAEVATNYPVIDGRTTPLDFGQVTQGGAAVTKTFKVENHGYANLSLSSVTLPTGYSMAEALNASIAAGSFDTFTVRLDTATVGVKSGQIVINSNDLSEAVFNFAIEGEVLAPLSAMVARVDPPTDASFFFDDAMLGKKSEDPLAPLIKPDIIVEPLARALALDRVAAVAIPVSTDVASPRELRSTAENDDISVDEVFNLLGDGSSFA